METARTTETEMCHELHPTRQLKGPYQQFHTKSWSDMFECPVCGLRRRFNLNYLGSRRVPMCDGSKIVAGPLMDWSEWKALTDRAKGAAIEAGKTGGPTKACQIAAAA